MTISSISWNLPATSLRDHASIIKHPALQTIEILVADDEFVDSK